MMENDFKNELRRLYKKLSLLSEEMNDILRTIEVLIDNDKIKQDFVIKQNNKSIHNEELIDDLDEIISVKNVKDDILLSSFKAGIDKLKGD